MQAVFTVLGHDVTLDCAEHEQRRVEDLVRSLEQRLAGWSGDADETRRLIFTALALMDEAQAATAALARARGEIERLTDMLVEARIDAATAPDTAERGSVGALRRVAQGAA